MINARARVSFTKRSSFSRCHARAGSRRPASRCPDDHVREYVDVPPHPSARRHRRLRRGARRRAVYCPASLLARRSTQQQIETPPQVRYAAAPRGQMGGGFIEFLFNATGEPPRAAGRRDAQYTIPMRGAATSWSPRSRRAAPRWLSAGMQPSPRVPRWTRATCRRSSTMTASTRPARSWSIRRTSSSIWSRKAAGRSATASASAAPASPGPA